MPRPTLDHMHSRYKPTGICSGCGQASTLLCDGRIYTLPDGRDVRVPMNFINGKTRSCDAMICRACAKKISDVHIRSEKGCRWDTRDLCLKCSAAQDAPFSIPKEGAPDAA